MNRTFLGVLVFGLVTILFDLRGLMLGWAGVVGASMRRRFSLLMIWGVLPGMLFCVRRDCVLGVNSNCLGAVGFGVVTISYQLS
jgi:hypothetical protein